MQLMPQKNCPTTEMIRIDFTQADVIALSKTANTVPPPSLTAFVSRGGEGDRQQDDVAGDRRVEDRLPDALGRRHRGAVRLLGDVRRGVEPGDRVLGQQEAERQHVPPEHAVAEARSCSASAVKTSWKLAWWTARRSGRRRSPRRRATCQKTETPLSARDEVAAADVEDHVQRQQDQRRAGTSAVQRVPVVAEVEPEDVDVVERRGPRRGTAPAK